MSLLRQGSDPVPSRPLDTRPDWLRLPLAMAHRAPESEPAGAPRVLGRLRRLAACPVVVLDDCRSA